MTPQTKADQFSGPTAARDINKPPARLLRYLSQSNSM